MSGPSQREVIPLNALIELIDDAAELGYETVAISGGEPLALPDLGAIIAHCRILGLRVTITTSGVTMNRYWADVLARELELVAVSVDGPREVHNQLRGASWAFDRMARALALLRNAGARFGILNTVTSESWRHMPSVAQFAHEAGAVLAQFHPLEPEGRARNTNLVQVPGRAELGRAWLVAAALQADYAGRMRVHFDGCLRDAFLQEPERFYAQSDDTIPSLAPALSVLVLEADGTLVPAAHGISRTLALGNVTQVRLKEVWRRWIAQRYPLLRKVARAVYAEIKATPDAVVFDWYARMSVISHELAVGPTESRTAVGMGA